MFFLLDCDRINNNGFLAHLLSLGPRHYLKHRSYSINVHWPEDLAAAVR